MDRSEALAKQYLETLDLAPIVYEPDGNVPPDFVLKGSIPVEVRRLNQNHEALNRYEGLEQVEAVLFRFVQRLLPLFGSAPGGKGWWVFFRFSRPLDLKKIKIELPNVLKKFCAAPAPGGANIQLAQGFRIDIRPAGIHVENLLMLGGYSDHDAGGFVAAEIIRNLNICIAEKARKIMPYHHRYIQWWLVLPDHIGPDLNIEERSSIGEHVDVKIFDRVILIHPRHLTRALIFTR